MGRAALKCKDAHHWVNEFSGTQAEIIEKLCDGCCQSRTTKVSTSKTFDKRQRAGLFIAMVCHV